MFLKRFFLIILFSSIATFLLAQQTKKSVLFNVVAGKINAGGRLNNLTLFKEVGDAYPPENTVVKQFAKLVLDKEEARNTFNERPGLISIDVPFKSRQYLLDLVQQSINNGGDFSFGVIENGVRKKITKDPGLNYRGYIDGDSSSFACISIFSNGEVMGLFCNHEGNFTIGRMHDDDAYVVYNSSDIINPPRSSCGTDELMLQTPHTTSNLKLPVSNADIPGAIETPSLLCNKVRLYWEADNNLYVNNFSSNLTNTKNYITGLFNMVSTVYENEGIQLELSSSYVWTTADPYSHTNSTTAIQSFQSYWNNLGDNFDADLAHLLAGGPSSNGGIAYLLNNGECRGRNYSYGYSNVYGTYQAYPAYSWDVYVVSHETGHNLGSNHTHWCGWNTGPGGVCGSIDNCYTQEESDTCHTCFATTDISRPHPGFKGTIMSYCHLVSGIGVDLANGFGPLPQAVIRFNVNSASCFRQGNSWTGSVNTAWENVGNWSCGVLPTATTDVTISSGLANYPVVKSAAVCHKITLLGNATLKVNTGFTLQVMGTSN